MFGSAVLFAACAIGLFTAAGNADTQHPLEERLNERWRWRAVPQPESAEYVMWIRPWGPDRFVAAHSNGLCTFDGYEWTDVPGTQGVKTAFCPQTILPLSEGAVLASRAEVIRSDGSGKRRVLLDTRDLTQVCMPVKSPDGDVLVSDGKQILTVSGDTLKPAIASPTADSAIRAIGYDTDENLWCVTDEAIYRRDADQWARVHVIPASHERINRIIPAGPYLYLLATSRSVNGFLWDGRTISSIEESGDDRQFGCWDAVGMPDGELVIASKSGALVVYRDGAWRRVEPNVLLEERNRSLALLEGRLVVLTGSSRLLTCDFQSERWTVYDPTPVGVSGIVNAIAPASRGGLWIGTDDGIARFDAGQFLDPMFDAEGTPLRGITTIQVDVDGHVWVGSGSEFNGARRWDGTRWHVHQEPDGVADRRVHAIRRGPDGALWFALHGDPPGNDQTGGLARYHQGKWDAYGTADGLPSSRCYDVAFAPDGTVYAACFAGVAKRVGDRWEPLPPIPRERPHPFALVAAPDGALWLGRGLEDRGVFRFADGQWTEMRGNDWKDAGAAAFAVAPNGHIWFGAESGLFMTDGRGVHRASYEHGTPSRNFWPVHCDERGVIWAGARGSGLIRYRPDDNEPPRAHDIEIVGQPTQQSAQLRWTARDRWNNSPPGRLRYRVIVDGERVSETDGTMRESLTSLSPGPHNVTVTAIDLFGNADPAPAQVSFEVPPATPHISSNAFLGLILIGVGALGIVLFLRQSERRRRRQAEREHHRLEASEEHFRTLVEGADVILARFDADGRLTYVSPQIQQVSGISPSALIAHGGMPREKIHPDDFWHVERLRDVRRKSDRKPYVAEFRISDAHGDWIWIFYTQRARLSTDGRIEGFDVAILDITNRKAQETAVRRERDFLIRLLEVAGSQLTELADFSAHVVNTMADALETSMACISVIDGDTVHVLALWDHGEIRRDLTFPIAGTIFQRVQHARPHLTLGGPLTEHFPDDPWIRPADLHCFAAAPMLSHDGDVIGVVAVMSEEERAFDQPESTRLRLFAQFASAFIERQQAETELQESERTLQTLMSNLPGMAYRCRNDQDWTMEFVSEGCRELCGYDASDLMYSRTIAFNDLINPDDQEQIWNEVQNAIRERRHFELVYRIRRADGSERWVWEQGRGVYNADDELVALEGFINDVSELRRAEAVQASQRDILEQIAKGADLPVVFDRLIRAVESLSNGLLCSVLLLDEDAGQLRHAAGPNLPPSYNQAINGTSIGPAVGSCGTAAYSKERVVVSDILTDPLWAEHRELALSQGLRACWSEPILSGDGRVLGTFAMYYREPRSPDESEIRLIEQAAALAGIAIERDRAEEALRRERDFNATLIAESPTFFVAINREGKTMMMNNTMLRALGYANHEVVGTDYLSTFVPAPDRAALAKVFDSLVLGARRSVNENRILSRDGRELLVEWHGNTVFEGNQPSYFFGVGVDITERRRLEEKFIQTQKMETVGRLAAGVAHDFNNLLTTLHAYISRARAQIPANHAAADALDRSDQVAEQCKELVLSLLTVARKLRGKREPVDFNAVVRQAVRLLEPVVSEGVMVSLQLDENIPRVAADAGQVHQIVMNLCMNACDAMPAGGQLEIRTCVAELPPAAEATDDAHRAAVELSIGDTGCGMDDATYERAFEPFFTTKEGGHGTGLGLSIVYGIVSDHGGQIHIATQPKLGTIVRVRLPAAPDTAAASDSPTREPSQPHRFPRPLTVLFADDETELLEANAAYLESNGVNVVRAGSGSEALRMFQTAPGRFDVIMLDHKMPGMNGLDCARRINKLAPTIPILMTTGYVTEEVALSQENALGFSVLQKPFRPQTLLERVRELAEARTPTEETR